MQPFVHLQKVGDAASACCESILHRCRNFVLDRARWADARAACFWAAICEEQEAAKGRELCP